MTEVLTAAQAAREAQRAAGALAGLGVRPGDRVAIVTPEHQGTLAAAAAAQSSVLTIVLGALTSGVMPVMINPLLTPDERAYVLADCQPSLTLASVNDLKRLQIAESASVELAPSPLSRPMHYTSGTTGHPKGVWTGDLTEAEANALWADEQSQWQFEPTDLSLVHGPLCHSGPLRFALAVLLAGGSVALPGWFDVEVIARATADLRPTTAFVVPSHLQRLFGAEPPPSPYRLLAHAGSACPPSLKRQIHDWVGVDRVWEFYGATEGQFTACSGPEWEARPGTVGQARQGRRISIQDGVIWCHAPDFARFRYFNDEDKTRAAWQEDAFSVGDLGRLDDDGYLYLTGRRDDLIISGGVNVYPAEVEAVLSGCPGVAEVAVYGQPDERWGQAVQAAYRGTASEADLLAWAAQHLAGYKRPKGVRRVDDFPRTASGKIKRLELAQ